MIRRLGSKKLGLNVQWQYQFPYKIKGRTIADMIFLDIGNVLGPGALDQHQDLSLGESTSDLIFRYPEYVYDHLMSEWESMHRKGEDLSQLIWKPTIITHTKPDFDGVVSSYLVQRIIHVYVRNVYSIR